MSSVSKIVLACYTQLIIDAYNFVFASFESMCVQLGLARACAHTEAWPETQVTITVFDDVIHGTTQ